MLRNAGVTTTCLGIGLQRVELALVPQNGTAQRRHHDANCPAGVALQFDDLVSTTNINKHKKLNYVMHHITYIMHIT